MTGHRRWLLLVLAAALGSASPAVARTWDVPGEVASIQAAIDSAASGDTVLVAPGEYFERLLIQNKGVALLSVAGRDTTILSGAGAQGGDTSLLTLDGASGCTIRGFTFRDALVSTDGGALAVWGGEWTVVEENSFLGNVAGYGGAIFALYTGALTVRGNVFDSNHADDGPGGAIDAFSAEDTMIQSNIFIGNQAHQGGAVALTAIAPVSTWIQDNVFFDNRAGNGSAISVNIEDLHVAGNTFVYNGIPEGVACGGSSYCSMVVVQFSDNHGAFVGNLFALADRSWAVGSVSGGTASFDCNVFWENEFGDFSLGPVGPGNLQEDPLLCNPYGGVVAVASGSPCLPENSGGCGLIGARGEGCSVPLAVGGETFDASPLAVCVHGRADRGVLIAVSAPGLEREAVGLVEIHDLRGRLLHGAEFTLNGGVGEYAWKGLDALGRRVADGIYFIRCTVGTLHGTAKIVMVE